VKAGRAINPCPPEVDSLLHESILRIGASAMLYPSAGTDEQEHADQVFLVLIA